MSNKEEIENFLSNGVYTLKKKNGRSDVWSRFALIIKENGKEIKGYYACFTCKKVLKQFGTATTNFSKHKCHKKKVRSSTEVSEEDKKLFQISCVKWCILDIIPFEKLKGCGFQKVIECACNISQKYNQKINVEDLIPDPTTISNNIDALYNRCKGKMFGKYIINRRKH